MTTRPIDLRQAERFIQAVEAALKRGHYPPGHPKAVGRADGHKRSAVRIAGNQLGLKSGSIHTRFSASCRMLGREPDWSLWKRQKNDRHIAKFQREAPRPKAARDPRAQLLLALRRAPNTDNELGAVTGLGKRALYALIKKLVAGGVNIDRQGERWVLERTQQPAFSSGRDLPVYLGRKNNTFLFGAISDNHLGSKYERRDVLEDLYDRFAAAGVDRVFNAGNWIDGEARFNVHDLTVHGLDAQMRYLADVYPRRKGIITYAVSGNDHEGWYAQRDGIDVGKYAENKMREAGRDDWIDVGYMEAHFRLVNATTGKHSILALVHPGGGTAYALSYSIQKIIEALEGGEKPAVGLYGHYHKLWAGNIRNVWVVCTGCTQDQTTFMRSKVKQEAHVGGAIVELEQDPKSGAIIAMKPQLIRYFNQGFYNRRWSLSSPVTLPDRIPR